MRAGGVNTRLTFIRRGIIKSLMRLLPILRGGVAQKRGSLCLWSKESFLAFLPITQGE